MKENYFIQFLKWAATVVEDDNGKVSIKRVVVLLLAITATIVILRVAFFKDPTTIDWASTSLLLGVIFGKIIILLGIGAFEKKQIIENTETKQ